MHMYGNFTLFGSWKHMFFVGCLCVCLPFVFLFWLLIVYEDHWDSLRTSPQAPLRATPGPTARRLGVGDLGVDDDDLRDEHRDDDDDDDDDDDVERTLRHDHQQVPRPVA